MCQNKKEHEKLVFEALTQNVAQKFKGCVQLYLVGGQAISFYKQKLTNENKQNSEPKQIRINQHLGALI